MAVNDKSKLDIVRDTELYEKCVVQQEKLCIHWAVENYTHLLLGQKVSSLAFSLQSQMLKMKLHSPASCLIKLGFYNFGARNLSFFYTVNFKTIDGEHLSTTGIKKLTVEVNKLMYIEGQKIGLHDSVIRIEKLCDLPQNILVIDVVFRCINAAVKSHSYIIKSISPEIVTNKVLQNLEKMYVNSEDSGVIFQIGDKVIKAHKCILNAHSEVFKRMLTYEKETINITDVTFEAMDALMKFMYCGKMPETDFDALCDLYYAADKYQQFDLKSMCSNMLVREMSTGNACRLLLLADAHAHSDEEMKKIVISFICANFKHVIFTEQWRDEVACKQSLVQEVRDMFDK